ncbi:MAG TPA: hypothetical protein VGN52_03555, partial [Burkholderiales bacterium]
MKVIFALAGVPSLVFDAVRDSLPAQLDKEQVIMRPLHPSASGEYRYMVSETNFYLKAFHDLLSKDHKNALGDVGLALIVLRHAGGDQLLDAFFPSIFSIPIEWTLDNSSKRAIGESK